LFFVGSIYFDSAAGHEALIAANTGLDFRFTFTYQALVKFQPGSFGPLFLYDQPGFWQMPLYAVSSIDAAELKTNRVVFLA